MNESTEEIRSVSAGMGIAGFIFALMGLGLSFFLGRSIVSYFVVGILFSLGFILSVIQIKKGRTGLSIAGLSIVILGILLILFFIFVAPVILSAQIDSISDELDSSSAAACFDAISSLGLNSACRDDSGIHLVMSYYDTEVESIMVLFDDVEVMEKELAEEILIDSSEGDVSNVVRVEIAPILSSGYQCDVSGQVSVSVC